jgi:hypothetical protein
MQTRIPFKLLGGIPDDDLLHRVLPEEPFGTGPAPGCVNVPGVGCVPQYAGTIRGDRKGFHPATDCKGYFTLSKFQVHNNCYNYAVDIATSTMAQPGRMHGLVKQGDFDPDRLIKGAELDGLQLLGGKELHVDDVLKEAASRGSGVLVAFLFAPPVHSECVNFHGDYHWVRCDNLEYSRWSHKPGTDQITTLDFAGEAVTDPTRATWSLNAGPLDPNAPPGASDFLTRYTFRAWMLAPDKGVEIV